MWQMTLSVNVKSDHMLLANFNFCPYIIQTTLVLYHTHIKKIIHVIVLFCFLKCTIEILGITAVYVI